MKLIIKFQTAECLQNSVSGSGRFTGVAAAAHRGRTPSAPDPDPWPPFPPHLSPDPRGLPRESLPIVSTTRNHFELCGSGALDGSLERCLEMQTLCPNARFPHVFAGTRRFPTSLQPRDSALVLTVLDAGARVSLLGLSLEK